MLAFSILLAWVVQAQAYSFDPLRHLAGISPYFASQEPPFDPAPPQGCSVKRAAYLVRHAAIVANDYDYETYIEPFLKKLANTTVNWSQAGNLSFLATWKSPINVTQIEELTRFGIQEATTLGQEVKGRYNGFRPPARVWSSTADRTMNSATAFINGFATQAQTQLVGIPEGKQQGALSLTPYNTCPAYSASRGSEQSEAYQSIHTAPIMARFNAAAPAFSFTSNDIVGMQQLCGYETVIRAGATGTGFAINATSPFCSLDLFTPNEWLGFEYTNDLKYFHGVGYGNPASGVIGLPWVKSSANLLLQSGTSEQDLYVSFTHRELPPTVLVALGLFNNTAYSASNNVNATMPTNAINPNRVWVSSRILPFLTNIALERLECASFNFTKGGYYRVLVNQNPIPFPGCSDGPGISCSAMGFITFMKQRQDMFGGFSEKCGVQYSNSTDSLTIYGAATDVVGNATSTSGGSPAKQTSPGANGAASIVHSATWTAGKLLLCWSAYHVWNLLV